MIMYRPQYLYPSIRVMVISAVWAVSYTHLDVYKRQALFLNKINSSLAGTACCKHRVNDYCNTLIKTCIRDRVGRICFVDLSVRCLYETVLIDSCIGCTGVDKTDVRSLRSLDRAPSSVMRCV